MARDGGLLARDACFPARDACFPARDACFPARDACFPARDACFPARDACFPARDTCFPAWLGVLGVARGSRRKPMHVCCPWHAEVAKYAQLHEPRPVEGGPACRGDQSCLPAAATKAALPAAATKAAQPGDVEHEPRLPYLQFASRHALSHYSHTIDRFTHVQPKRSTPCRAPAGWSAARRLAGRRPAGWLVGGPPAGCGRLAAAGGPEPPSLDPPAAFPLPGHVRPLRLFLT